MMESELEQLPIRTPEEYREFKQREVRAWLKTNIRRANEMKNEAFSKILLLSIIDCFAQAHAGYTHKSKQAFCDFILAFSKTQSEALQNICPVTLAYDYELPFPELKKDLYFIDDQYLADEGDKLLLLIPEGKARNTAKEKHRYVDLLYSTRSKLVHELNTLGHQVDYCDGKPTIAEGLAIDVEDGKVVEKNEWGFYFPKKYIYDLTKETVYAYLDYCRAENKMIAPIQSRKCRYAWYD